MLRHAVLKLPTALPRQATSGPLGASSSIWRRNGATGNHWSVFARLSAPWRVLGDGTSTLDPRGLEDIEKGIGIARG